MAGRKLAKLQAPKKVYEPTNGNVEWKAKRWLAHTDERTGADPTLVWDVIHLQLIHPNPFNALSSLGVFTAVLRTESTYECPYTGYVNFGIVPHSVLTKNAEQYRENVVMACGSDPYVLDFEWLEEFHGVAWYRATACEPTDIMKLLLGSGYTHGTLKSDGHGRIKPGVICLTNGDYLRVNFWEWYNK